LNFEFLHNRLRAVDTGRDFQAEELTIVEHHRFEGITNPSDESIVYAVQSSDGARGVLVDAYGVYANPDLAAFLDRVAMREDR
jgi:hypothetical protein